MEKIYQNLIKKECANYIKELNHTQHYCCWFDKQCFYFAEGLHECKYFNLSVLPLIKSEKNENK
jgi:hypothetical protein